MSGRHRSHRGVRGYVLVLVSVLSLAACGSEQGALRPRGQGAREVAWLFWTMTAMGALVVVVVTIALFLARHGDRRASDAAPADESTVLGRRSSWLVVGGGVVLPVVVLVPLAVAMMLVATRIASSGPDPLEVEVVGHQYWWEVRYPGSDVITANEIHVPVGRDVRLTLRSEDVIHSFWVPQLGPKIDMIPGRTTELVIDADEEGEYLGQCAEFCGLQHARMRFLVIAQAPDDFDRWLEEQAADADPPADERAERGADTFVAVGCAACHRVRGTQAEGIEGPDLTHLASRRTLGAATMPNERAHLAEWIVDPQATKPGNLMPETSLAPDDRDDLVAYLEGLG